MTKPMTNTVSRNLVQLALENSGLDGDCLSEDYFSPGTMGERCFALTFDNTKQMATFFLRLGELANHVRDFTSVDDLENMIDGVRQDITARGIVVSFPGWTLV